MSNSQSRKATAVIAFRMTTDEADALRAAAKASGLGPTTFARRAAFEAANLAMPEYEGKTPDPRKVDAKKIIGEINKIGSNANQIAKVANTTKQISSTRMKALFAEIRALRVDILNAMGL